jgi:hypothetical protein
MPKARLTYCPDGATGHIVGQPVGLRHTRASQAMPCHAILRYYAMLMSGQAMSGH